MMNKFTEWIDQLTYGEEIKQLIEGIREGRVWQYSVFIAYYTAVSVFPLLVGILNVFGYFNLSPERLIDFVQRVVPGPFVRWIEQDLQQIYEASNVAILLIAAVTTIWTISWAMAAVQMGLNQAYGVSSRKNLVVLRIVAFLLTFVFAAVGAGSFFLINLLDAGSVVNATLSVIAVAVLFSLLYLLVPNVKHKWQDVWPGTIFATIFFSIAAGVYMLFMEFISQGSTFYTTIGTFTFVMVLLQLMGMMGMVGGVMNQVYLTRKYGEVTAKNDSSKFLRTTNAVKRRMTNREEE